MSTSFGLLIQGPLLSGGRTGKTIDVTASEVKDDDVVEYDCRKNINLILNRYAYLFEEIIVSTWVGEFEYAPKGVKVCRIEEKTVPDIVEDRKSQNKWVAKNNILKQYIGTSIGIHSFENNVDYLIKIRTDQYLDLDRIVKWLLNNDLKSQIGISNIYKDIGYLPDFYFAGKFHVLREYFDILSSPGRANKYLINTSPHSNGILKYAYEKFFNIINLPPTCYSQTGTHENQCIYVFMMNFAFKAIPLDVYESVEWRGHKFTDKHIQTIRDASTDYPIVCLKPIDESAKVLLSKLIKKIKVRIIRAAGILKNM